MTTHRLVLLRHAKAEHGLDVPDHDRPLTLRGRRQSAEVGTALAEAGLVPDLVLCSSSVRTRQTWELARGPLGAEPEVVFSDELYDAGVRLFTLGFGGPDWDYDLVKSWLRWRDAKNGA